MKYALVIVGTLGAQEVDNLALCNLARDVQLDGAQTRGVTRLNAGAYAFQLDSGLSVLCALVEAAKARKLRTHTLFFDQAPSFVVTSP